MPAVGCVTRRPEAELDEAVARGAVPGVAFACGIGPVEHARYVGGVPSLQPDQRRSITTDTAFDLASLTKVVATTPAVLALLAQGRCALDTPLRDTGLDAGSAAGVTVGQLLTHTGGLRSARRFYLDCPDADALRNALRAEPLVAPPGVRVRYSDLGFLLLGELVAHLIGAPFDVAVRQLVLDPQGLRQTTVSPAGDVAATELAVAAPGVVHDRNARLLGGAAGHAGLFAPLDDVVRSAVWWCNGSDEVAPATYRDLAVAEQTAHLPGGRRGLGWARRGDPHDVLDEGWSADAVSHTGFTGTSIAIDRSRGWWAVLLTNALHLGRDATTVGRLRRRVHSQVATLLETSPGGHAAHA